MGIGRHRGERELPEAVIRRLPTGPAVVAALEPAGFRPQVQHPGRPRVDRQSFETMDRRDPEPARAVVVAAEISSRDVRKTS